MAPGLQALADASGRPQREEEEEEEDSKGRGKAVENADGPQVGISHKKRYPTVNEIEVIGGYLSLERSCMSKTGSRRKKVTGHLCAQQPGPVLLWVWLSMRHWWEHGQCVWSLWEPEAALRAG